jgi:hypothetical protein
MIWKKSAMRPRAPLGRPRPRERRDSRNNADASYGDDAASANELEALCAVAGDGRQDPTEGRSIRRSTYACGR